MSRHGGWKAQRSSSGARATSLETAVAPIHHRRESACSLDVGLVPAALQRVVGLTSRLDCTLAPSTAEGTVPAGRAADGLPRRHWYRTACLRKSGLDSQTYTTYRWTTPGARDKTQVADQRLIEAKPKGKAWDTMACICKHCK